MLTRLWSRVLRDWFAGQALTEKEIALLIDQYMANHPKEDRVSLQTLRYFHGDQMLAARAKGAPQP